MEPRELHAELATVFQKHVDVCTALLSVLEEEHSLLVGSDPEKLYECLKRKEVLALKLGLLVDTAQQIRGRIAETLGLAPGDLSFVELTRHLEEPHRSGVRNSCEQLRQLVGAMGDLTRRTGRVVAHTIVNIDTSIGFLRQLLVPCTAYTPTGKLAEHGLRGARVHRRA